MNIENADAIRLIIFFSLLVLFVGLEYILPRRQWQTRERIATSTTNLAVVLIGSVSIKLLIPIGLVFVADLAVENQFGLLQIINMPQWLVVICSVVVLDGVIYWQHRLFHIVPIFWRLHRMHHSDTEMGTTTALRFHPVELLLSYLIKIGSMLLLGVDPLGIVVFEILLNGSAMWNHSNLRVVSWLDWLIRWLFVTPDMHRVHHSVYPEEHSSNYGFFLSIWDRLFGSHVPQPRDGHMTMTIGLDKFRQKSDQRIDRLLLQPFVRVDTIPKVDKNT